MTIKNTLILLIISFCFAGCEEDAAAPRMISSLKVVHALTDAPPLHINYFGEEISFADNPALAFGETGRYTIPANVDRMIAFTSAEDTLSNIYQQSVNFEAGDIHSLFLTGQMENIQGLLLKDKLLTFTDSAVGVRFVNLSPDVGVISVGTGDESGDVISGLDFRNASDFMALPVTQEIGAYQFQFKDDGDHGLVSVEFNPLPTFGRKPIFKNVTFVLIGLSDDGSGSGSLSVMQIDHF